MAIDRDIVARELFSPVKSAPGRRWYDLGFPAAWQELHRERSRLVNRWLDEHDFDFIDNLPKRDGMLREAHAFADRVLTRRRARLGRGAAQST